MAPHIAHIQRVHTDGFISDVKLPIDTPANPQLGDLKFEKGWKKVTIVNSTKITYL